jgi:chorismate mutase
MNFESELKELRKEVDMADKKILEALSTRFIVTNMI